MKVTKFLALGILPSLLVGSAIFFQPDTVKATPDPQNISMVSRTTLAVRYPEKEGTAVDLIGTGIQPHAYGKAEVKRADGRTRIKLKLSGLDHPQSLGSQYTCYILWAVTPEGQADNLGELSKTDGNERSIEVTTNYQTFGLIVTAEPHGMVQLPGPRLVAENILRNNTKGGVTSSQVEYRGDSGSLYAETTDRITPADYHTPLSILGARRAVEIARRADAQTYAPTEMTQAENRLVMLEGLWQVQRTQEKRFSGEARDVMRLGEHARQTAVEHAEQARLDAERRSADRAVATAESEADRAQREANRANRVADQAQNEAAQSKIEADQARSTTESYRLALERSQSDLATAKLRVQAAQNDADRSKANEDVARLEAENARLESQQAKGERDAAQQHLFVSLTEILETRREARGLIVSLSDVLFDTGQATLKPGAREKLSKLAGVLMAYPGQYRIEIEGHTDSVGNDDFNNKLSLDRAAAVQQYLMQSGIPTLKIVAVQGFGKARPVSTNQTPEGRQMNRRVEIVIGDNNQTGIGAMPNN